MNKITRKFIAGALAFAVTLGTGAVAGGLRVAAKENAGDVITVISPAQKQVIDADNEFVADFFINYEPNYSKNYYGRGENLPMKEVNLKWSCEGGKYYVVYVDTSADFSSAEKYTTVKPELALGYLVPNSDYYWKVKVVKESGEQVFSKVYTFRFQAYVRSVKIDGVMNVRDLGGSVTTDGKTVKYGILYRSAQLEDVTEKGKIQAQRLGIKTDLDLRGYSSVVSPLGEGVKRINYSAPWYADEIDEHTGKSCGINGEKEYVEAFANEIKVCADPENYPMLFHCSLGRDRTGTLAAVLLAVCGVAKEDVMREYELSWFSEIACTNSGIQISAISRLLKFIEGQNGEDFKQKTANYLLSIGVSQSEIDSVREILLG